MQLKKRFHIEPNIETSGKVLGKGDKKILDLQGSKGFDERQRF
jgi:hypothetical protein